MWVLTVSSVVSFALLSLSSASFSLRSSLRFKSSLNTILANTDDATPFCGAPLSFRELEAETIEHELMFVIEDIVRPRRLWREPEKVFH